MEGMECGNGLFKFSMPLHALHVGQTDPWGDRLASLLQWRYP